VTYTYDFTANATVARIRMRIRDRYGPNEADVLFTDEEIEDVYANLERSSIKRTCAYLLETIADDEALTQKVIKLLSLSTNGPATAASLRESAANLRLQADEEDSFNDAESGVWDTAEQVLDDFTLRERVYKQGLRGS